MPDKPKAPDAPARVISLEDDDDDSTSVVWPPAFEPNAPVAGIDLDDDDDDRTQIDKRPGPR